MSNRQAKINSKNKPSAEPIVKTRNEFSPAGTTSELSLSVDVQKSQQGLFEFCPLCKHIKRRGKKHDKVGPAATIIHRHWKPAKDYICGWCFAVFDTGRKFQGYQKDLGE